MVHAMCCQLWPTDMLLTLATSPLPCLITSQGAIDAANQEYQKRKTVYSARINVMVDYLNQALPLQQLQQAAAQLQRVGGLTGPGAAENAAAAAAAVAAAAAAAGGAPGSTEVC